MSDALSDADGYQFGAFTLSPRRRELRCRDVPVTLGTRAFDLLLALIQRRGRLATRDELLAQVWPGTVVDDNNLAAQISGLRRVMAADPSLQNCLRTIPGRGYCFVADVAVLSDPQDQATAAPKKLSIVVMPFASLSDAVEQVYFAQGMSHTVATDLSRVSGLRVIASSTAAALDGRQTDARQVSRELGTHYVMTGSVQRDHHKVRVNAQLVDGRNGAQVWSERFDGNDGDLLSLQDQITGRIANSVGREVFVAAARDGPIRPGNPTAIELLVRGIAADNRPQSLDGLRAQVELFARATLLDPDNADAFARLARAILLQVTQGHARVPANDPMLASGIAAAERAVMLDPGNARAHYALGLVHVLHGAFERSALANETAIALDRNFALAHNNLGNSLVHLGKGDEALVAVQTALMLDPRGPQLGAFLTTKGFADLIRGDLEQAADGFQRARSANPRLPRALLGVAVALALRGEETAGRHAASELLQLVPHYRLSDTMDGCRPDSAAPYRTFVERVLEPAARRVGVPT